MRKNSFALWTIHKVKDHTTMWPNLFLYLGKPQHRTYCFHSKCTNPTDCNNKMKNYHSIRWSSLLLLNDYIFMNKSSFEFYDKFGHSDNTSDDITWYVAVNESPPLQFRISQSRSSKGDPRKRTRQLLFVSHDWYRRPMKFNSITGPIIFFQL